MNNEISHKNVLSNLVWRFLERSGSQIIQFVVSIILAQLLTPADYGVIGLITVFISIAQVFINTGFSQSLIQKKDADDVDFSSVFYSGIVFSIIIYGVLYFSAPFIASFYENELLTSIVRVLGLTVVVGSVNCVQTAYVQRTMQFKRFFWSTLIGTLFSAIVGITMAYKGFGVWSLVGQQIINTLVNTIVLWFTVKWRPILAFSFKRLKGLLSYGWKLLFAALFDTLYQNIYSLIIGKKYSTADLGYYNKGKQFSYLIINNINSSIDSVLFPAMSNLQESKESVKALTRRAIKTSTFVIFPAMAGLAAVATPLIRLLLTDKWLPCVPFLQFCCFAYAFWPIHTANLQAIKAMGRSDIFLKLEIIKKVLGIVVLIITVPLGLIPMMIGRCVTTLTGSFINAFPNRKLLDYSYFEQIKDIIPSLLISLFMAGVVLILGNLNINTILVLIIQIVVGIVIYVTVSKIFKIEAFEYIINMLKKFKKR